MPVLFFALQSFTFPNKDPSLLGAWYNEADDGETICFGDGYFVFSRFNKADKKFFYTWGGPYQEKEGTITIQVEFDSRDKALVGKQMTLPLSFSAGQMVLNDMAEKPVTFKQLDDGKGLLAGNWRISARKQGDQMTQIPLRARKTIKLLTANRFQWIAINTETGEFFGTGGGVYTFRDGQYTEQIEFFSRDSSRVGASLSFEGRVENGQWHHSGFSSKGDPIYEIWTRDQE
ncbi:MAG: hypothetical protein GC171_12235 [Terrimonas sp.]|nr:hypothetical protein [Terrimonas sp.]